MAKSLLSGSTSTRSSGGSLLGGTSSRSLLGGTRAKSTLPSDPTIKQDPLSTDNLMSMLGSKASQAASAGGNFLHGALDIVDRGRNAIANLVAAGANQRPGEDPWTAIKNGATGKEHAYYGDILRKAGVPSPIATVGGFAGDAIIDPANLIGLGEASKAVKVGEGTGKVALNGAGREFLQKALARGGGDVSRTLGEDTVRNNIAKLITNNPEKYGKFVDQGGIKIAGQSIIKGKTIAAANDAIQSRKFIGAPSRAVAGAKNAIVDNFKVGAALDRAGGGKLNNLFTLRQSRIANADDLGKGVANVFKKSLKGFTNDTYKTVDEVSHVIARAAEEPAFRKDLLEKFPTYKDPLIGFQKVMGQVAKSETDLRAGVKGAGLVENYRPHLFKEKPEVVDRVINDMAARGKALSPDAFFLHNRTTSKTAQEIVDHAKEMGITLTPLSAHESIAARLTASERALANHDFVQSVKNQGVESSPFNPAGKVQDELAKTQGSIEDLNKKTAAEGSQLPLFDGIKDPKQANLEALLTRKSGLDKAAEDLTGRASQQFHDAATAHKSGWIEPGIPQLKGTLFPPEQAKELTKLVDSSAYKKSGPIMEFMDKAMGLYKGAITQPFGAFHIRNKIGNIFNGAYLGGVGIDELPRYMKYQKDAYAKAGEFISQSGRKFSKQELEKLGVANAGQAAQDAKSFLNPLTHGRQFGTYVENADRIALFMNRIDKGDSVENAVAHVNKFLFNYGNQTKTVKNLGRVVPFFTWTANNIPLQLEQMIKQPAKFSHLYSAFNEMGQQSPDMQNLPAYAKSGLTAEVGSKTDANNNKIVTIARNFGLPVEDLQKIYNGSVPGTLEQTGLGSLTPLLRLPAEVATKQDFYRQDSFDNLKSTYGNKAKNLPQFMKDWLGYKEEKYTSKDGVAHTIPTVDPTKFRILESSPFYRFFDVANAGTSTKPGDSSGSIQGRAGAILQKYLSPVATSDYNVTAEKAKREKEAQQALINALVGEGKLKQYTNTYKPKQ